jgi:hypothetical protein
MIGIANKNWNMNIRFVMIISTSDPDMSEEEINQVIDDYYNRKERPQLRAQCDFDEDIPF